MFGSSHMQSIDILRARHALCVSLPCRELMLSHSACAGCKLTYMLNNNPLNIRQVGRASLLSPCSACSVRAGVVLSIDTSFHAQHAPCVSWHAYHQHFLRSAHAD